MFDLDQYSDIGDLIDDSQHLGDSYYLARSIVQLKSEIAFWENLVSDSENDAAVYQEIDRNLDFLCPELDDCESEFYDRFSGEPEDHLF